MKTNLKKFRQAFIEKKYHFGRLNMSHTIKKNLVVLLLMLIISVLAFYSGFTGLGSNLIIIRNNNEIDCFFKETPTAGNFYFDCFRLKYTLTFSSEKSKYYLAGALNDINGILDKICQENKQAIPEFEALREEINLFLIGYKNSSGAK